MSITENAMKIILRAIDLIEKGFDEKIAFNIAAKEILDRGEE